MTQEEIKMEELTKEQLELVEKIKNCSSEINGILVKYELQFQVTHKIVIDPDLKREDIAHDIVLRPK